MRGLIAVMALISFSAGTSAVEGRVQRVLLSVDGLGLRPGEALKGFHIETWGVEFLSVCYLPKSWEIKSEKFEDPEGWLDGKADSNGIRLKLLPEMFLVDVFDYQPVPQSDSQREYHPPSFSGWLQLGTTDPFGAGTQRKLVLNARNFTMKAASICPPAPPAQP